MTSFIKRNWFYVLIGFILLIAFIITLIVYEPDEGAPVMTSTSGIHTTVPPGSTSVSDTASMSTSDIPSDTSTSSESTTTPPETTTASPVLPATNIKAETRSISLKHQDKVVVNARIDYPKIETDGQNVIADRINAVFSKVADIYNGYANENMFAYAKDALAANDPSLPYRMNVEYSTKFNSRTVLSVVFTSEVFTGGSHEYKSSEACNVGADGNKLTLSSIFKVDAATYQNRIWDAVIAQIGDKTENYFKDYKDLIKTFDLENRLYFTNEGLTVIYNPYEIATYAEGILHFTLPYDTVSDILAINPLY